MRTALLLSLCVALTASAENTPGATNPSDKAGPQSKSAAVFTVSKDVALAEAAGKLDAALTAALRSKGVPLVDFAQAFPPPEPESLEPAKKAYQEGRQAYDNLDPDTAVTKFNEAIATYLKHPVEVDPPALAEAYVWLGASLQLKGDNAGAKDAFTRALLTYADATADPQAFGKDLLSLFGDARAELEKHPTGKLTVDSIPSGARAFVRGEELGVTPLDETDVPSGRVRVVLMRPGYVPYGAFPEVPPDQKVDLKPTLEPTPGLKAMQSEVEKLTTSKAEGIPPDAKAIGSKLQARYLVMARVFTAPDGRVKGALSAWDLSNGNKLEGLLVDAQSGDDTSLFAAADQVKAWIDHPPAKQGFALKVPAVAKKWWFWAAVGGAAAVVATGVAVAQPHHRPDLVLGTP